jgi:hypothetical protein
MTGSTKNDFKCIYSLRQKVGEIEIEIAKYENLCAG